MQKTVAKHVFHSVYTLWS